MPRTRSIAIIVPTMATAARAHALKRALDSLRSQVGVRARPIVVVNGSHTDPDVIEYLKACTDITLIRRDEGNYPRALAAGRELVDTEYFGVLDDDDEYLPDALATRCGPLDDDRNIGIAVTCGLIATERGDVIDNPAIETYRKDPLGALINVNWLTSCGALYRSSSVGADAFIEMPRYLEWTHLAVRLSLKNRIAFIGRPTYRLHPASPDSLSASDAYMFHSPDALAKVIALGLPPRASRVFGRKYRNALHALSAVHLRNGDFSSAWSCHLRSLNGIGGYKYILYARHIVRKQLRAWLGARA